MSFVYVEGFDSLQQAIDVQNDGWRSSASNGLMPSSIFGFTTGRLNARSFGCNGTTSNAGLGRPLPPSIGRSLHKGWAYRTIRPNTTEEQVFNLSALLVTAANNFQKPVFVWTFMAGKRLFALTVNENTNITNPTSTSVSQSTLYFPAPDWFNFREWNFFELIISNNGTEAYCYVNGEPVAQFLNMQIVYPAGGFTQFFFNDFPTRVQWDFPVDLSSVAGTAQDINAADNRYFVDDIFIRQATGVVPMGDFRMNDGIAVTDFSVEFTPTVGSTTNFENLDDPIPDGDVSIVSANTAPRTDLYSHNAVTSASVLPQTLVLKTRVQAKNGVAAPVNLTSLISDGLISREGAQYNLTTTYTNSSSIFLTSATNAAWTKSSIEASLIGFQNKVV